MLWKDFLFAHTERIKLVSPQVAQLSIFILDREEKKAQLPAGIEPLDPLMCYHLSYHHGQVAAR